MSVLFYETGDNLRARAFLQRYLGSNMPTAPVLFHGIRIEEKLGDDNARREFTLQLLRDFPESAEAERIRQTG
jgi:Tfp pilus assembly protein PilF